MIVHEILSLEGVKTKTETAEIAATAEKLLPGVRCDLRR
jgi:hypothetical protein